MSFKSVFPGTHRQTGLRHTSASARHLHLTRLVLSFAVLVFSGASARAQSALDGFDPNANNAVRMVVVQPDGKMLIAGDFTTLAPNGGATVTRNRIARLNADGTLDTAFNPNANGLILSMALQTDGKVLVCGTFTTIGGQTRNRLARLDGTTGLADSFDPNPNNLVYTVAVQTDGKILAGGDFTTIGGQTRNRLARLDAATGLADAFDPNADTIVFTLLLQPDGKILAAGNFTTIGGQTRNHIARLDPATGVADAFNPDADNNVLCLATQPDGKLLVGGIFTTIGGQARGRMARLDPSTGLADSFNANVSSNIGNVINVITVQPDGQILVGGNFASIGGQMRSNAARLNPINALADSFSPNPNSFVNSNGIVLQPDGKILLAGGFTTLSPDGGSAVTRNRIARLETGGRVDQTLDNLNLGGTGPKVFATAVQPEGKILIGGSFSSVLGVTRNNIARLNADGTLDTGFNPNASAEVSSIAVQLDGKIVVGGGFTSIGGQTRNSLARLDAATGLADSFNPNGNGNVHAIVLQADGKVLVGGSFTTIGGQTRNRIARLDAATGLADSFNPNADGVVLTIGVQADGKILVGGDFTIVGGEARLGIARLEPVAGAADAFNPNANGQVTAIVLQPDGKILAGGIFTNIGGQSRGRIARLDAVSGLADSFNPNADSDVISIALQADGKVLASGVFASVGGQPRSAIARLEPATGLADSFNPAADSIVHAIAVQSDGKILAGGEFASIGGQTRNRFGRLTNDTIAAQNLSVTKTSVTWTRTGSSPQLSRVTFEDSPDGVSYNFLGHGTATGNNWTLTGLNFSIQQNLFIRARGFYRSGSVNGSESIQESVRNVFLSATPTPTPTPSPTPPTLGNISTRLRVETGDNALIGGFIVTGAAPKSVLVRAIGPSLSLAGKLANPMLELHDLTGTLLASNDNWMDSANRQEIIDTTIPPSNDLESAILATLDPGAYTAIMRGVNNSTGIGLVEAYDLSIGTDSILANISTRGLVQTGDDVMIGGFIIVGDEPQTVLVRAIGPSLPLAGKLADPELDLHNPDGSILASNDNWRSTQEQAIIDTTIPPTNDLESAILATLAPNGYTAIVRGNNGTTGVALVEAYQLDN